MRLPGAKVEHPVRGLLDPLERGVESEGPFPLLFLGEGEVVEAKAIAPGGIDVIGLLDGLAAKQFALPVVVVPEVLEYLEQLVDRIGAVVLLTHFLLFIFFILSK